MSKAKILLASLVWLFILGIGVLLYRLWYVPTVHEKQEQEQGEILSKTGSESRYEHQLKLGVDAFSGYAILRSDEMSQNLRSQGIKLDVVDDGADYSQRLAALNSGELQFAAFPIDALLKTSAAAGRLPATIIAILDETRGADAVLAYKERFPNVDALNSAETRFVLVGDSPSETLVRVLMHDFQLDQLSSNSIASVSSEQEVISRYKQSTPQGNEVFVTWEPVVSEILKNDRLHTLIDSSRQSGYIVDALAVSRDFLIKNEAVVRQVLECYFRTQYYFSDAEKLATLVRKDAADAGTTITVEQTQRLVQGIVWKNTQENFAHFGLRSASVTHIEDMIDRIKRVLMETGGLTRDPTDGESGRLYYRQTLSELQASGFHPGVAPESVRGENQLVTLSEAQWGSLAPVGTLSVPQLVFARGTSRLTERSRSILDELKGKLESWPQYYLMVRGNAGSLGDPAANRALAKQRAEAALQYLQQQGVAAPRMRVVDGEITGEMSVSFVVGQLPY